MNLAISRLLHRQIVQGFLDDFPPTRYFLCAFECDVSWPTDWFDKIIEFIISCGLFEVDIA